MLVAFKGTTPQCPDATDTTSVTNTTFLWFDSAKATVSFNSRSSTLLASSESSSGVTTRICTASSMLHHVCIWPAGLDKPHADVIIDQSANLKLEL